MTLNLSNVNITTNAGVTLTVAQLLAGFITRTGPTSTGFTDTLTVDGKHSGWARQFFPAPFVLRYINATI